MAISKDPERRRYILEVLRKTPLEEALGWPKFRAELEAEAASTDPRDPDTIITPEVLQDYLDFAETWRVRKATALMASRGARAIIVPGFLGSALRDATGPNGLIWVDPELVVNNAHELSALRLAAYDAGRPEADAMQGVRVGAAGCVPLAYDLLGWFLWMNGYSVSYAPYDWRKHLDEAARQLEQTIRDHFAETATPVRLIAHSQGSLVARRALQMLGANDAMQMVQMLVLLGPATFGTFTAAQALSGNHEQIELFRRWAFRAPADIDQVFQSMTGLYQLLPWNENLLPAVGEFRGESYWKTGIDAERLKKFFGWAKEIDARFFNDRTRVILGDAETVTAVAFQNGKLTPTATTELGDGTVPDILAKISGVLTFKAPGATHALMAANFVVCRAVISLLGGSTPKIRRSLAAAFADETPALLLEDDRAERRARRDKRRQLAAAEVTGAAVVSAPPQVASPAAALGLVPPEPIHRKLRVFALDPLLSTSLETADYAEMVVELNWNDVGTQPAPVGEYLEVVDVDPQSGRYYPPVDLNHPYLLASEGLKPSEKNPQFHQQMTFAVSMATIRIFEKALGRVALWSPRLIRNQHNQIQNPNPDSQYVPRLRIYPHAMRQRNAYYDPDRKALLFGYFPADGLLGGRVKQGGTIFTAASFDIIAHETSHALLDGLHRYLIYPSNADVLAFHEGFSDIVALLQRFSHREFLRAQVARTGGDLTRENLLGQLAGQFAAGSGGHGNGLRQYLGKLDESGVWRATKPDPTLLGTVAAAHDRGAILVAAVLQALENIYRRRSADLLRMAHAGRTLPLDLAGQPDLVERLADEAATSARHLLRMCVRALDYLPPVDLTLGEYLRALITADYDLVRDDDRRYRVAVVDAFRQWGIYPADTGTLLESDLIWQAPEENPLPNLIKWIEAERKAERFADWVIGADRQKAFRSRAELGASLHEWLLDNLPLDGGRSLGLCLDKTAPGSINRGAREIPKFEIHAVHPCSRIGPDGQHLQDLVIEVVQRRKVAYSAEVQQDLEAKKIRYADVQPEFYFRGGCTLIVDGRSGAMRYVIRKGILKDDRLAREREFRRNPSRLQPGFSYFDGDDNSPFRFLHGEGR